MSTFVEVANGATGAANSFSMKALLVQEVAQFFQVIARNRGLVGGYRVVSVVVMAARRVVYAIGQVYQLVRDRDFNRLWLHVWFNEDDMAVCQFVLRTTLSLLPTGERG